MTLVRAYLLLQAFAFAAFVVLGFAAPATLAGLADVPLATASAVADFRAVYGGLSLALTALFVLGAFQARWRDAALFLAIATSAGLCLGRVVTLATHGPGNLYIEASMALEIASTIGGVLLVRAAGASRSALIPA